MLLSKRLECNACRKFGKFKIEILLVKTYPLNISNIIFELLLTGLDETSLNTSDGHSSNTTDFVDVLEGETEGLVGWTGWGNDGVKSFEHSHTLEFSLFDLNFL